MGLDDGEEDFLGASGSEDGGGGEEEDSDFCSVLAGAGEDSSAGISRVDMSSPASAMTAMRVPTLTPLDPPSVYSFID